MTDSEKTTHCIALTGLTMLLGLDGQRHCNCKYS